MEKDVQIPRGAAATPFPSFSLQAKPRAAVNTWRDFDMDVSFRQDTAFATALRAWCGDDVPLTSTLGAGGANGQKALRTEYLPPPLAHRTSRRPYTVLPACAAAWCTDLGPLEFDIELFSHTSIEKRQGKVISEVRTLLGTGRTTAPLAKAQQVLEEVAEGRENIISGTKALIARAFQPLNAITIIDLAFFRIAEDLIGLGRLFEFLLGRLISWIPIRMVLQRKPSIGFLDVLWCGVAWDPKHCIVILGRHA
jgi:hypothetical protein